MRSWEQFIQKTTDSLPRELYLEAIGYLIDKTHVNALDIAAGGLNETKHMLKEGFDVVAFDASPLVLELESQINNPHLNVSVDTMQQYDYGKEQFDLIIAMFALPFISPDKFEDTFQNIASSLRTGGIFAFHLFGPNDEWCSRTDVACHTQQQARQLVKCNNLDLVKLEEHQGRGRVAVGGTKHWHTLQIITRKL